MNSIAHRSRRLVYAGGIIVLAALSAGLLAVRHQTALLWLALVLLAALAGAYRIVSLTGYLHDPHLITVSLTELLIVLATVVLVAPDAVRAQTATPAPPPYPRAMTA